MTDDVVIRAEGLGKKYVIGHAAERERYVALRDVLVRGAADALADGELGTVITEKDDLPAAIARFLDSPKPDPDALSRAVRARFGRAAFKRELAWRPKGS